MTLLSNSYWLSLSWETRLKLIDLFGMQRTGASAVSGGKVDADGYQHELDKVTTEDMQKFLAVQQLLEAKREYREQHLGYHIQPILQPKSV